MSAYRSSRQNVYPISSIFACLLLQLSAIAALPIVQHGEILDHALTPDGGYTVLRLWGTHQEMGEAYGKLMTDEIVAGVEEMKSVAGERWGHAKQQVATYVWPTDGILEEFDGMLAGIKSVKPETTLDRLDLQMLNTYGDWSGHAPLCRSTSCWGAWMPVGTQAMSIRRLDYGLPNQVKTQFHMVVCGFAPTDGSLAWVNVSWPGYLCCVTGINEFGTLASLHDWPAQVKGEMPASPLPRSAACRWVLTGVSPKPGAAAIDQAAGLLKPFPAATSGLLNLLPATGDGGVILHTRIQGYYGVRRPHPAYMGGQALICMNDDFDSAKGGDTWTAYYEGLNPKVKRTATLKGLWNAGNINQNMHIAGLAIRAKNDMTIWAEGKILGDGRTKKLVLEWSQLIRRS